MPRHKSVLTARRSELIAAAAEYCEQARRLLKALKEAEAQIASFCDTPNADGCVIAPDSIERVRLSSLRKLIKDVEARGV